MKDQSIIPKIVTKLLPFIVLGALFGYMVGCRSSANRQIILYWVDILGNPKIQGPERARAEHALQSIGTNALPLLLEQAKLGHAIDGQRRMGVVMAFEVLGNTARGATSSLSEIIVNCDMRSAETALWALSNMGSAGVESMTNVLSQVGIERRRMVIKMLHSMGTNAFIAIPAFLSVLKNPEGDHEMAFLAGCAAARCTLEPNMVVHVLHTNLLQADSATRYGSASGLAEIGTNGVIALPSLRKLLSDTNQNVREAASNAVFSIDLDL